jgi:predicted O-linked N-acetylglucosamine transferase (SPINDLY family)
LGIVALRPAPVIASWLGYIGTLGEPRLADYVIGDAIATPTGIAAQFSESLALMPRCFQPGGKLEPLPPPPSRSSQGLPEHGLVFCSFNQTFKLHPALWDDWCEILRQVPGSVLWLAPPRNEAGQRNLRAETERRGVDPKRLCFATQRPRAEHLARLALADIALDTYPYNSGTTASDALRAGVPLLAFPGETFVSRMAVSLLSVAGLHECIARDRQDYVALAIRMGIEVSLRERTRQRLRENLPHSGLFRPQVFAHDLERLYRAMHTQKLAGTHGPVRLGTDNKPA